MKKFSFIMILQVLFFSTASADCSDCESEAYDGIRDSKKAYKSSDLDSCQSYSRKAYKHFSNAESYAGNCGCDDAESAADDAYRDAKKAYRSSDLDSCQFYAKKAKRHGEDTESYASYCN
jgi:hypothetical protein